jgi:hypothetical protein
LTVSDIHIDDFYKDAAKILVLLYNHFPRRITLYVEDISGPDKPDEFGLHHPRYEACFHTMLWLASTGYIEYSQTVQQDALDQTCLTHRTFLLLNSAVQEPDAEEPGVTPSDVPPVLAGLETLAINRLRKELNSGTSYSLADLMKRLMNSARHFS